MVMLRRPAFLSIIVWNLAFSDAQNVAPFWPEENCQNAMVVAGGSSAAFGQQSVNPFSSAFQTFTYNGNLIAGPMLNDTQTPCLIQAFVGQPVAFDVYAEDVNAGDVIHIYVLEDPGLPNGAYVTQDSSFQRCFPIGNVSVGPGGLLGPCPLCQNSGQTTYGIPQIPATPAGSGRALSDFAANLSSPNAVPAAARLWCRFSFGLPASLPTSFNYICSGVGQGKLEAGTEYGRLVRRKFVWTPFPQQGGCQRQGSCNYTVKFQAMDAGGLASVVKTFVISVAAPLPAYGYGTYGMVIGGNVTNGTDVIYGVQTGVSGVPFVPSYNLSNPATPAVYDAYINCPMEITTGIAGRPYSMNLSYISAGGPPAATVTWRTLAKECRDAAPPGQDWRDGANRSCADYAARGWCAGGAVVNFPPDGLNGQITAIEACCVCGAGAAAPCSSYTTQAACEPLGPRSLNAYSNDTIFPRQRGCKWDSGQCVGLRYAYFVSPGVAPPAAWVQSPPASGDAAGAGPAAAAMEVVAVFRWTPVRGMEGMQFPVCFNGSDASGVTYLRQVCAVVSVKRCYYCARVGETLDYIAQHIYTAGAANDWSNGQVYNFGTKWRRLSSYKPYIRSLHIYSFGAVNKSWHGQVYNLDTNWLRLWNYNPSIPDPDLILRNYLPVVVGSTYQVTSLLQLQIKPGDTLSRLAARLRTTVKKILEVNPDLAGTSGSSLQVGQEVCVMPCTTQPYAAAPIDPYLPGGIAGLGSSYVETVPRLSLDPEL